MIRILPFLIFSGAFAAPSSAQQFEDVAALDKAIAAAAPAQPIDARLKLARCPQKPIIASPVGGAVTVRCVELGWRILVPLAQNAPAQQKELRIHKGDPVELTIDSEGFEVSSQAIALQDGAIGDDVRVKTLTAAVVLTGQVTARGTVRVLD